MQTAVEIVWTTVTIACFPHPFLYQHPDFSETLLPLISNGHGGIHFHDATPLLAKGWAWNMSSANQALPEIWIVTEVIRGKEMVERDLFQL